MLRCLVFLALTGAAAGYSCSSGGGTIPCSSGGGYQDNCCTCGATVYTDCKKYQVCI